MTSRIQTVICVKWSSCFHLQFIEFKLFLASSLIHHFWWVKTEGAKEDGFLPIYIPLCISCVVSLYKLVALFSRVLSNNSWIRTFRHPINLEIKSLICVAKYDFRPSILKYSQLLLNATERE